MFVTVTSLFLAFFPGALVIVADSHDTPQPKINKADEKSNVKSGWSPGHSSTKYNWDELQGGSSNPSKGGEGGSGNGTSSPTGGIETCGSMSSKN